MSANPSTADAAYDIPALSKHLDFINLMSYDFHSSADGKTGANAAFADVKASVDYWLEKGAAPQKLILGVGAYGQTFTLADPHNHGFNAPSNGPGEGGNQMPYYKVCEKVKREEWKVVHDPQNKMSHAYKGVQFVSFDGVRDIQAKGKYVCEKNLGGSMVWSIDLDDFKGSCGCGKYPLLSALNQQIRGVGGATVGNCP